MYDIDGDGSDEVMCGYGNIVFFADRTDGSIKFKAFMRKVFLDKYDYVANGFAAFDAADHAGYRSIIKVSSSYPVSIP